jgi:predicted secreted protein
MGSKSSVKVSRKDRMMTMLLPIVAALVLIVIVGDESEAEPGDELWNVTFGGSEDDGGGSIYMTSDGGFIIAGATKSYGNGNDDVWLLKTDENGEESWNKTFGGGGRTKSYGAGNYDFWLIKTDNDGNALWDKTFGGSAGDANQAYKQTLDGGFICSGWTTSYGNGYQFYVVKTDSEGNADWANPYGGSGNEVGFYIQPTSDGGYLIIGMTESFGAGGQDLWLLKIDENGDEVWDRTHGGVSDDVGLYVHITSDDGLVILGYTESYGAGGRDVWFIRTDENGDELWSKTFGGSGNDEGSSVMGTSDGGFLITGHTTSYGAGDKDIWVIKTDKNGEEIWSKTFGGSNMDAPARCVQETSDGDFIIIGSTESYGSGGKDAWLLKVEGEDPEKSADPDEDESPGFGTVHLLLALLIASVSALTKKRHPRRT